MEVQPIVDFTWEAFLNERICVDFETKENSNLFFSECIKRGKKFYIHIPEDDNIDYYEPTKEEVPDVKCTHEVWVKKPVKLKLHKIIQVTSAQDNPLHYTYGGNKVDTYKWNYDYIKEGDYITESNIPQILFHGSHEPNLKELEPRVSTHGIKCVYATNMHIMAVILSADRNKSHDGHIASGTINGLPYISEVHKGALNDAYKGVKSSIYTVSSKGFHHNTKMTNFEFINPNPVSVLKEEVILDLLSELERAEKEGRLFIKRFKSDKEISPTSDEIDKFTSKYVNESGKYDKNDDVDKIIRSLSKLEKEKLFTAYTYKPKSANTVYEKDITYYINQENALVRMNTTKDFEVEDIKVYNETRIIGQSLLYTHNVELFDSGDINILLITGVSGSGKTTLGNEIAKHKNAIFIELDTLENYEKRKHTRAKLFEEYYDQADKTTQGYMDTNFENVYNDVCQEEFYKFFYWLTNRTYKDLKKQKYIIEGVQIYEYIDPNSLKHLPIIMIDKSLLGLYGNRFNRFISNINKNMSMIDIIKFFNSYFKGDTIKGNLEDNKKLISFRNQIVNYNNITDAPDNLLEDASINESTMPKLGEVLKLNKKLNKFGYGYIKGNKLTDGVDPEDFSKRYRTISPSDFEKYRGGVCWDYVEYQATQLKKMGLGYSTFYIELNNKMSSTHTFTVIPAEKIIYIESSYGKIQGVWESNSLQNIFNFILKNMFEDDGQESKFEIYEYNSPIGKYDMTTIEFMDYIIKNGTRIKHKYNKEKTGLIKKINSTYTDNTAELYSKETEIYQNKLNGYIFGESYINEGTLTAAEKKALKSSDFGIPKKRKYPMPDKAHVYAAIRYFNYADAEDKNRIGWACNRLPLAYYSYKPDTVVELI